MAEETNTERLQNVVDKAKTISLLSNLHNLTLPQKTDENPAGQVAIIEALKVTPRLLDLFLEIRGVIYDQKERKLIQVSRPIMNVDGSFRFVKIIQHIAEETEFSNFHEDDINGRIYEHYKNNLPYFTFWHEEYDLDPSDFNYIATTLMSFIDASFHKSKGAKLLNVPGRVYSEDFLGRTLKAEEAKRQGILSQMNPFKKK
jgi:hypothetical protein